LRDVDSYTSIREGGERSLLYDSALREEGYEKGVQSEEEFSGMRLWFDAGKDLGKGKERKRKGMRGGMNDSRSSPRTGMMSYL
jgi:hypothetical protein